MSNFPALPTKDQCLKLINKLRRAHQGYIVVYDSDLHLVKKIETLYKKIGDEKVFSMFKELNYFGLVEYLKLLIKLTG